jgi:dolichol kinase
MTMQHRRQKVPPQLAEQTRRLRQQWDVRRHEMRPDAETLRSWRRGVEWDRKGIHLVSTLLALWTFKMGEPWATGGLALATCGVLAVDFFRLRSRRWAIWCYRTFPFVFRGDERRTWTGASVMMIGATLTSALFPRAPATAGILCLTWGDSAAALVGQFYQHWRRCRRDRDGALREEPAVKHRRHKTWAGTLGFVVSTLMNLIVIGPHWITAALAGVVAAAMERWTHGRWDNLTIPLGTASVIHYTLTWFS